VAQLLVVPPSPVKLVVAEQFLALQQLVVEQFDSSTVVVRFGRVTPAAPAVVEWRDIEPHVGLQHAAPVERLADKRLVAAERVLTVEYALAVKHIVAVEHILAIEYVAIQRFLTIQHVIAVEYVLAIQHVLNLQQFSVEQLTVEQFPLQQLAIEQLIAIVIQLKQSLKLVVLEQFFSFEQFVILEQFVLVEPAATVVLSLLGFEHILLQLLPLQLFVEFHFLIVEFVIELLQLVLVEFIESTVVVVEQHLHVSANRPVQRGFSLPRSIFHG
jgi:hypothetical protein